METTTLLLVTFAVFLAQEIPHFGFQTFEFGDRIVGGKDAVAHEAPYIVSLQKGEQHFCILFNKFEVVAGVHELESGIHQKRSAEEQIVHEHFDDDVGTFDIALIIVDRPFIFDSNVQPVALPADGAVHSGQATLYGWGSTSNTTSPTFPRILQTVEVPIIGYEDCQALFGGPYTSPLAESNLCAGSLTGGISACSGDSGGTLVQVKNEVTEIIGIVSWGFFPCGIVNAPSVYTRTSAYVKWIAEHLPKKKPPVYKH